MKATNCISEFGFNLAKTLRCARPWFSSGRGIILDSGFASFKCVKAMTEHGMFVIGNVKSAHVGFPKKWLVKNASVNDFRVYLVLRQASRHLPAR